MCDKEAIQNIRDELVRVSSFSHDSLMVVESMDDRVTAIEDMMKEHKEAVEAMIAVYETGTGLVAFLKWLSKLLAAIATIWGAGYAMLHWRPH